MSSVENGILERTLVDLFLKLSRNTEIMFSISLILFSHRQYVAPSAKGELSSGIINSGVPSIIQPAGFPKSYATILKIYLLYLSMLEHTL